MNRLLSLILALFATSALAVDIPMRNPSSGGKITFQSGLSQGGDFVYAYNSGDENTSTTGGSATIYNPVSFDTETLDSNNAFVVSGTYTCSKAGLYRIEYGGSMQIGTNGAANSNAFVIHIKKNGSDIGNAMQIIHSTGFIPYQYSIVARLAVSDTVTEVVTENAATFTSAGVTIRSPWVSISYLAP